MKAELKTSDLRLGNYIQVEGKTSKIDGIQPYWVWFDNISSSNMDNIEPIPLDEPWLNKLGLHSYELGYYNLTDDVTIDVEGQIRIENEYTTKRIWIAECYHVHSLMNFYHSLTGEELTVSM